MTPEAPNTRKQKRAAAVCCCIAGLVLLAGLVCHAVLLPRLLEMREQTYQSLPYMLYRFSVPPVTYGAAGLLLASLFALIATLRLPGPLRVIFLVLGTAFCLPPLLF